MPDKAKENRDATDTVLAKNIPITKIKDTYYCVTPDCPALMTIVKAGNIKEAYFRRIPSSPYHISSDCVRCSLIFEESKYDERKFNVDDAFGWFYESPIPRFENKTGLKEGHVGGKSLKLRTLGNIYKMCVSKNKTDTYNGILIDDLFADKENFERYRNGLIGNKIVECSYWTKVYNKSALLFNYPTDFTQPHIILRVNFSDEDMCWKYFNKFKGCHHTEPIAIAGEWTITPENSNYQFECTIVSSRQIHYVK